jgi:nucleoside-diphosphate-sugar epimerase
MDRAIITGVTGLVGKAVAKYLVSNNISVLGLGRKQLLPNEIKDIYGDGFTYLNLSSENLDDLGDKISLINWQPGQDCIFFHFAWSGQDNLTSGTFQMQLNNAIHASNAVKVAKKIGCIKFINSGSLEETYAEQIINHKLSNNQFSQLNYAISKLASRNMCKMIAYLEKIDYVHTRMSVPLDNDLAQGGYVASTLRCISQGKPYELPINNRLFDIIFVDDVAKAYFLIGLYGKNKADYFIGTSRPVTLGQYFSQFEQFVNGVSVEKINQLDNSDYSFFDISLLSKDTGFKPSDNPLILIPKKNN